MRQGVSLGCRISQELMPILMIIGAVMTLAIGLGIPSMLAIMSVHILVIYWIYTLKNSSVIKSDIRFLAVPLTIAYITALTHYNTLPALYDQAYHLQISNRMLNRWEWEPFHQGLDYSFRPELVPGLAAIELFWTDQVYQVNFTPLILLCATGWALHNLADNYSDERFGFIAPVIFLSLPVVMQYGPTMLLDVHLAGMIMSVLFFQTILKPDDRYQWILFGVLVACLGLTKYPYFYVGPCIAIIFWFEKKYLQGKYTAIGYGSVTALFLIKNMLHTKNPFGPMSSQISGTIASVNNEIIGTEYSFGLFLDNFITQWPGLILLMAVFGHIMLMRNDRSYFRNSWLILLPAIILHGIILDFGWIRYSTPWLALACVGVPCAVHFIVNSVNQSKSSKVVISILFVFILIAPIIELTRDVQDIKTMNDSFTKRYGEYLSLHIEAGEYLPDDAIVLTSFDITFALYASTETYPYLEPTNPINHAIDSFDPSHIYTDSYLYRYDIDVNFTYLYGSPIEPEKSFHSTHNSGYLWTINKSKMENISLWEDAPLMINGPGSSYGNFALLEANATLSSHLSADIYRIIELNNSQELSGIFDVLSTGVEDNRIICSSVASCEQFNREENMESIWAVWLV